MKKMKKIILVLLIILFNSKIYSQLLDEDFSGTNFPPIDWSIDDHSGNWSRNNSNFAGGTAPEAMFSWNPQFNGDSRLISPAFDLTGTNTVTLTFKHSIDHYGGAYTVGVATRSGNGSWNTVWSMQGTEVIEEDKILTISNSDTGQSDFQFCFFFSGNSYNINFWLIDNVKLFSTPSLDLAISSIEIPDYTGANQSLSIPVKLFNLGQNDINSFDISYAVDGNSNITENVNATIHAGDIYSFTFATPITTVSGNHQIEVNISNINGGNDDVTANNVLTKNFDVASQVVSNFPLFEEFTSSTCSPCANFNSSVMGPFMNNHQNDVALIKYQMNWPSPGDDYYTAEGGERRVFYGVGAVPTLFIGGKEFSSSDINTSYTDESNENAFMDMAAQFSMQGSEITTSVTINPYITGNFVAHIVVIEKETTGNVGSNGETSFQHVMMKMLPDANGTSVNLTDGTPTTLTYTYDMDNTHVEELSDLAVVAFVQNPTNKDILQSVYAPNSSAAVNEFVFKNIKVYPNPTSGKIFLESQEKINYAILNIDGKVIKPEKYITNNNEIIDISHLPNGIYLLKLVNAQHTEYRKIIKK